MLKEDIILSKLDKIDTKLENLDSRTNNIEINVAKQGIVLEEHQRRSIANEENNKLLKKEIDVRLKPVEKHIYYVNAALKIFGGISVLIGVIAGTIEIISYIHQVLK